MNKEEAKKQIDSDDASINGVKLITTCRAKGIIEAIDDHQKVNLPREVGEELEDYQNEDIDLLDYLHDVIDSNELRTTRVWMLDDREHRIGILADAYRYGWEAEPEAKWYVQTPNSWKAYGGGLKWLYKGSFSGVDLCIHTGEIDEQFTSSELKKYHLDSDIFTLVPVEEEK